MVQAIINIEEHTNKIINVVKAKYGLKDKSSAINLMAAQYEEEILDSKLKPEYVNKATKIMEQNTLDIGTVENLRKKSGI
jgi:hypothetical protein